MKFKLVIKIFNNIFIFYLDQEKKEKMCSDHNEM